MLAEFLTCRSIRRQSIINMRNQLISFQGQCELDIQYLYSELVILPMSTPDGFGAKYNDGDYAQRGAARL